MDVTAEWLRFDDFELRPESGELFRGERKVRLQQQPAKVLELLARRAGQVVPRDEIARGIWGDEHYVDAEQGLNYCVRQIRIALGDEADAPRFVETVPRRGYRFVAPVAVEPVAAVAPVADAPLPALGPGVPTERAAASQGVRWRTLWGLAILSAALVVIIGMRSATHRADVKTRSPIAGPSNPTVSPETTVSPEAREAYLEGVYLSAKPLSEDRVRAIRPLRRALELAPDFAPAHAAWARLQNSLYRPPSEALPEVEEAVERALELDPSLPQAHITRARVRMFLHRDWAGAEAAYRRALELDPKSIEAHLAYGHLLSVLGRHDEALALVHRARELDPASALISADLGWYYYYARRFAEAEKHSRATLRLEENHVWALWCLILTALERGDEGDALAAARHQIDAEVLSGRSERPDIEIATLDDYWRARLAIYAGWRQRDYYVSPTADAMLHLALGDRERAFDLLEQACQEQALWPILAVDRRFDALRGDERFDRILACAGFGG